VRYNEKAPPSQRFAVEDLSDSPWQQPKRRPKIQIRRSNDSIMTLWALMPKAP